MGYDGEDDMVPPDEDAEDFANFNPQNYLNRRGFGDRYNQNDDLTDNSDEQPGDDFANFDPGAYVRKRHSELGRSKLDAPLDEVASTYLDRSRRGRRRITPTTARMHELDQIGPERRGCLAGVFDLGERFRVYSEILTASGPMLRIGCLVIVALGGVCVVGYLALTLLLRR